MRRLVCIRGQEPAGSAAPRDDEFVTGARRRDEQQGAGPLLLLPVPVRVHGPVLLDALVRYLALTDRREEHPLELQPLETVHGADAYGVRIRPCAVLAEFHGRNVELPGEDVGELL